MNECILCSGINYGKEIFNVPLMKTENFVVLADRLPIAKYHFIIVSREHFINVWDVINAGHGYELQSIIEYICGCLNAQNENNIFAFEHGQSRKDIMINSGKSVEHFHLHIVVDVGELLYELKDKYSVIMSFDSFEKKIGKVKDDYLLVGDLCNQEFNVFVMKDGIPSQFMREFIYSKANKKNAGKDGYNWKINNDTITYDEVKKYKEILNGVTTNE